MSAKKQNPNAAFSQTLTPEQKAHYDHALVIQAGLTYLFSNAAATIAIVKPDHNFGSYKEFLLRVEKDNGLLEQFHQMAFQTVPTKSDTEDLVEWSVKVWMQLCRTAANRLSAEKSEGRKPSAKMLDRKYEVVSLEVPVTAKMPPQAKVCLEFFAELQKAANHDSTTGIFTVSEKDFMAKVFNDAPRLKTRQSPWRIFQYYRPELIKAGHIRLV